jgi:acetylornithine/N-succinyldiaminopimelate aminotransferase
MNTFDVYSVFDIEIAKAKGLTLWDTKGATYMDLYGGHAVISIGHSHPHYVDALTKQLQNIGFYSNSIRISAQNELAQKLGVLSGYPDYQLFLCNSGAEANENALKLASFHNGRKKVISFTGAFHGRTSLAVAATDNPTIVAPINETPNVSILPFNDIERLEAEMDASVCAILIEGVQGVGGVVIPTIPFLKKAEALCQKFGAVLILDEVQSGYGRTGKFFAHQHADIQPHIITVAKGMGNGFPIGGVLIAPEIKAKKEQLGTTFGGNYLACAAAIAVLEVIDQEQLIANAYTMGNYLTTQLQSLPYIKEIRAKGLMVGIELDQPCATIRKELLFTHHIFTGSASNKNTIRILPSLAVTKAELDVFISALKQTLVSNNKEIA